MLQVNAVNETLNAETENFILEQLRATVGEPLRVDDATLFEKLGKRKTILQLLEAETRLSPTQREKIRDNVFAIVFDPVDAIFLNPHLKAIRLYGSGAVYENYHGWRRNEAVTMKGSTEVRRFIDRLIGPLGLRLDDTSPMVTAKLADGSRLEAVVSPLSQDGPVITITKSHSSDGSFSKIGETASRPTLSENMIKVLRSCARGRVNIIVSGTARSCKTALLNALCECLIATPEDYYRDYESVVTVEKQPELNFALDDCVKLTLPIENWKAETEITPRMMVKKAVRMQTNRIIIGDCNGAEAAEMFEAMANSHPGSMCTVNASNPLDCLERLEHMVLSSDPNMRLETARHIIGRAFPLVIQVTQLEDGTRAVTEISQVQGVENGEFKLLTVFYMTRAGRHPLGNLKIKFNGMGQVSRDRFPKFLAQAELANCHIDLKLLQ